MLSALILFATVSSTCGQVVPVLALKGEINDVTAAPLAAFFMNAPKRHIEDVTLEIDSPGGLNVAGFALIDAMQAAEAHGVRVTCVANEVSSMAAILFESACTVRKIRPGGYLLFHESAFINLDGVDVRLTKTFLTRLADDIGADDLRTANLIAARVGMKPDEYLAWIAGRERRLDAAQALTRGFADDLAL